jgi:hypothetical protein
MIDDLVIPESEAGRDLLLRILLAIEQQQEEILASLLSPGVRSF